jgi:hypothetical protein
LERNNYPSDTRRFVGATEVFLVPLDWMYEKKIGVTAELAYVQKLKFRPWSHRSQPGRFE